MTIKEEFRTFLHEKELNEIKMNIIKYYENNKSLYPGLMLKKLKNEIQFFTEQPGLLVGLKSLEKLEKIADKSGYKIEKEYGALYLTNK